MRSVQYISSPEQALLDIMKSSKMRKEQEVLKSTNSATEGVDSIDELKVNKRTVSSINIDCENKDKVGTANLKSLLFSSQLQPEFENVTGDSKKQSVIDLKKLLLTPEKGKALSEDESSTKLKNMLHISNGISNVTKIEEKMSYKNILSTDKCIKYQYNIFLL
jgi:hypothetical protein